MELKKFTLKIMRCNPQTNKERYFQDFLIEIEKNFRILDGLIKVKDDYDGSLTFRRSCAHGICGSCAMKINGINRLACQTLFKDMPETIIVEPLPAFTVINDLVVDMNPFFNKNEQVLPYLINEEKPPEKERHQDPKDHLKILESITCILCASCTSSCPSYWADKSYAGPAALLKAYRFIFDSRDKAKDKRIEVINQTHGLWRCHNIFNCTEACPKEIKITEHLSALKREVVKKKLFSL